jgi:flagellar assembly factor FliW
MILNTTRFGRLAIAPDDVITFVDGLIGMEDCRRWVLLADAQNESLAWLQSLDRPQVALAVVAPRRFVPDYQVRVARRDVQPLGLADSHAAQVLTIITQSGESLALNLKAPLVIHLAKRLGRQIVSRDDQPLQFPLAGTALRKTA